MALSYLELEQIKAALEEKLVSRRIQRAVQYSNEVFLFSMAKDCKLVINMEAISPYVYVSSSLEEETSLSNPFLLLLRKNFSNAKIKEIILENNDRILRIRVETINELFKPVERSLIIEMIPSKANLILLDENDAVLGVFRSFNYPNGRLLLKGIHYEAPEKKEPLKKKEDVPFDLEKYMESCEEKEASLLLRRRKEIYHPLLSLIARKQKSSKKKIEVVESDLESAKTHLDDGKYGDYIYTNYDSIQPSLGYFDYEGEKIKLDPSKSVSLNAQAFYKRAKKSKTALEIGKLNLEKAKKEAEEFDQVAILASDCQEEILQDLSEKYLPDKKKVVKKKKANLIQSSSLPYYIVDGETTYLFGKNAKQNDFLTFYFDTAKKHIWMHIQSEHGAHLIIRKEKVSDEELGKGAELCCLLSSKEEGEVQYAYHKEVKKGSSPGQVILNQYDIIRVEKVEAETKRLLEKAKRIEIK